MPIIKDQYIYETITETQSKPVTAFKIQMDILDGCNHNCPGCHVIKVGNSVSDNEIDKMVSWINQEIINNNILLDEIVIGPVDFLSATNLYEVLSNKKLLKLINDNSVVLAFPTPFLQLDINKLEIFIDYINLHISEKVDMEFQIAINPTLFYKMNEYRNEYKSIINKLNRLKQDTTFTFSINIDNYDIDYIKISEIIYKEFDTIIDFLPSFTRKHNISSNTLNNKINIWNKHILHNSQFHFFNNAMLDHSHGGFNYNVINYKQGSFYISPFYSENLALYHEKFKIDNLNHLIEKNSSQKIKGECKDCDFLHSCLNRKLLLFKDFLNRENCIAPKEMYAKYKYTYSEINKNSQSLYNWDNYSIENEKNNTYRRKFHKGLK